ncbi:MAG: methyl-accepting chemotaxis protein [Desulfobacterales bacterium]|nr:methyl-accepting chemotaxis protein [Desulfobacterales bacterium]
MSSGQYDTGNRLLVIERFRSIEAERSKIMKLHAYFKEHLWVQVLTLLSTVFILVMGTMITLNIRGENTMVKAEMKHQGEMLAESVEGSMDDALAIGDNEAVRKQFQRLKKKMPDMDIFVFGFNQAICFATNPDVAGKSVETLVKNEAVAKAVAGMLEDGEAPAEPFEESINGTPYITLIRPVLNDARCFHCHGSSRKVLGGALIRLSAEKGFAAIRTARNKNMVIGAVGLGIMVLLIYAVFHRLVNTRIEVLLDATSKIGQGDLTYHREIKRKDELAHIGACLNNMAENLRNTFKEILSGSETLASSSTEMLAISEQMSSGAEQTSARSNNVASAAEEMSSNMTSVASAMEQASTNVGMVATAAEQMTTTINEIAQNSEKACSITGEAVSQAKSASAKIDELGKAAREIGMVTETITEISEQTNLLALNATIEAARAGEAGKGFAVVANEIKELAKQTAGATEEIKNKIEGIQDSTAGTVSEIEEISKVINEVNEIVSTIATAIEEQSVTTKEIANNVAQTSKGIEEVTQNVAQSSSVSAEMAKDISDVNQAATEMSNSSSQINLSAKELSKLSEQLKEMVGRFKV